MFVESLKFFSRNSEVSDIRDSWRERRLELIRVKYDFDLVLLTVF